MHIFMLYYRPTSYSPVYFFLIFGCKFCFKSMLLISQSHTTHTTCVIQVTINITSQNSLHSFDNV